MNIKYVVLPDNNPYGWAPYVFPACITHDDFRANMGVPRSMVHSAGFVWLDGERMMAFGESISIGKGTVNSGELVAGNIESTTQELFDVLLNDYR